MKNIVIKITLIFATFFSIGCSIDDKPKSDGLPYYQFTQEERNQLISNSNVGDEIIYKNQDNNLIKFKTYNSKTGKTTFATGNFSSSYATQHFHYDRQEIAMWYSEGLAASICEINILKYPVGSNYQTQYPVIGTPKFYGYFEFPLWNGYDGTDIYENTISINFDLSTRTMTFNGKTYSKVRVFESNRTVVLEPNNKLPLYPKNVNIIYYDDNYGIIGFDDLNGKLWRLQ